MLRNLSRRSDTLAIDATEAASTVRHFEPSIIILCIRRYLRFSLSLRNVEELMAERNLTVDHVTIWAMGAALCTGNWKGVAVPSFEYESLLEGRRDIPSCGRPVDLFMPLIIVQSQSPPPSCSRSTRFSSRR
jgi:hypothetical protein